MRNLLFLAHRIPYPPNKGDKIRSWHLLRHLADSFAVHLGCFVDDEDDWRHVGFLEEICASCRFARLDPRWARLRSLRGLATGAPLTFPYFWDAGLAGWVEALHRSHDIAVEFVFSSSMAPYLERRGRSAARRIVDFIDVDSEKWAQYAESQAWPMRFIYGREGRLLADAERRIAADADASFFVSEAEAALFRRRPGVPSERVHALGNGVDLAFFAPHRDLPSPYPAGGPVLVFTGAMDYRANVDAVCWFAREAFPLIREMDATARFFIVGARPAPEVQRLAGDPSITVTGRVEDVRPYVTHAAVAVAPLRIARGIQNKVLEAMAMAVPVVATPQAFEGIDADPQADLVVAGEAPAFARAAGELLADPARRRRIGEQARRRVEENYGWDRALATLDGVLRYSRADTPSRPAPAAAPGGTADLRLGTGRLEPDPITSVRRDR
ncbi:TIGR03087 family PEP-CTERM/XrtA system glycosyltransferase [Rhodospirillaceae bacterium SYSU D60014]|uniref:TIGR03087 family PEP-CTERM/XrtA system glycosyltransferase n=1 Tax=Virgifigura deserti TaxID=2268457 RepID=UPI000E6667B4